MVAEQNLVYDQQNFTHDIDSRSPPPNMMLQDTKYFPGHPALPNHMGPGGPFNPSFGGGNNKRDIFSQRKQREFIPENKKDDSYWDRRRRNNEAAKRSREKRRLNDMLLETRVIELSKDNHILQAQLNAIFEKYGIKGENMITMDVVMSTMPSNDQVLNFTKKRLGPLPDLPRELSPNRLSFQSLGLPISINNNNNGSANNNNNNSTNNNNNTGGSSGSSVGGRSCSPERSLSPAHSGYRSPSPAPHYTGQPSMGQAYSNLSQYSEELYRHQHQVQQYDHRQGIIEGIESEQQTDLEQEDDRSSDKDSGLALNLSTDRSSDGGHSQADESGRSSVSGTPPVTSTSSGLMDSNSSGDESGYPRSPNSGSCSGVDTGRLDREASGGPGSMLPHKLRFKSAVSEKEAVSSLLSLHQMALIKREPVEHINHWMENAGNGLSHAGLLASLLPHAMTPSMPRMEQVRAQQEREEEEPVRKRTKVGSGLGGSLVGVPDNLKDEVARLTSEVATLKNILVNRMRDETDGDVEEEDLQ